LSKPPDYNVFDFDPANHVGLLPSPCINICEMNPHNGLCKGCLRTIDEIVQWGSANEAYKHQVWKDLKWRVEHVIFN
jgi:uncharacterized protein